MNFKDYILNDIDEQKTLISLLPKNTENRKKKYNDSINNLIDLYEENRLHVKEFIDYKYNKILPKEVVKDSSKIDEEINNIKKLLVLANKKNSFFEKLGLDKILYGLMHYYDNSLVNVNLLLKEYIDILLKAGIKVSALDFRFNVYSYVYMYNFFDDFDDGNNKEFQKIFWLCPKVIEYIIISLRFITSNNKKKLTKYASTYYNELLNKYKLKNIYEAENKLIDLIKEREKILNSNEYDIVNKCINRELDINNYVKNSADRNSYYEFFMINPIDLTNEETEIKYVNVVSKLLYNLKEYKEYNEIIKLIDEFKKKYAELEKETFNNKELNALVKKFNKYQLSSFDLKRKSLDELLKKAKKDELFKQDELETQLYAMFTASDNNYFNEIIKNDIKDNSTVDDVLVLFNSYYYFLKKFIKSVLKIEDDSEINQMVDKIYNMIYNPNKKIIEMMPIFSDSNILQQLMNGYRFENLNITIDSFTDDNINQILDKGEKILIGMKVDKFKLSIDEINFLVEVNSMKRNQII